MQLSKVYLDFEGMLEEYRDLNEVKSLYAGGGE
jgi:hypothetical protein